MRFKSIQGLLLNFVSKRSICFTVKIPPVPIKTYEWEDLRRSRRKGGYPWTHIYKEPFLEEEDPEDYTMDAFRRSRSKSNSTLGKSDAGVVIEDVTDVENDGTKWEEEEEKAKSESVIELADSSGDDNVSQYLDKEIVTSGKSDCLSSIEEVDKPECSKLNQILEDEPETGGRRVRAKSEEPKRKRKHSVESSYSRISLSRLGMMKRLKEAKEKIKLPKLPKLPSFKKSDKPDLKNVKDGEDAMVAKELKDSKSKDSTLKLLKSKDSKSKEIKPKESKSKIAKSKDSMTKDSKKETKIKQQEQEEAKPVYIHIPLKPPPGETDEFSKYAMEVDETMAEKKEEESEVEATNEETNAKAGGPQLIILTAPSDDEILDEPPIPDTPSECDRSFDKERYEELKEELKNFAKDVIEEISPSRETTPSRDVKKSKENIAKQENITKVENAANQFDERVTQQGMEKNVGENDIKEITEEKFEVVKEVEISIDNKEIENTQEIKEIKKEENIAKELQSKLEELIAKNEITKDEKSSEVIEVDGKIRKKKLSKKKSSSDKKEKKDDDKNIDDKNVKELKNNGNKPTSHIEERMMFDEEDGLKLSETAVALINEEMKKESMEKESCVKPETPKTKKKVSFKRKSKATSEHEYEEIKEPPSGKEDGQNESCKKNVASLEKSQTMSQDDEKSYLDEKIIKTTSLEEDYNRWSKIR